VLPRANARCGIRFAPVKKFFPDGRKSVPSPSVMVNSVLRHWSLASPFRQIAGKAPVVLLPLMACGQRPPSIKLIRCSADASSTSIVGAWRQRGALNTLKAGDDGPIISSATDQQEQSACLSDR